MTDTQLTTPPTSPRSGRVPPRRTVRKIVAAALVLVVLAVGSSVLGALRAPGTDSTAARLAEWGRGHGLSPIINQLERWSYHAPPVGGGIKKGSPLTAGVAPAPSPPPTAGPVVAPVTALAALSPFASPALPGEGSWRVLSTVGGRPALQVAYLRPDAVHTSFTAGVVWMDPTLLRFALHPGSQEPGGAPWSVPPSLAPAQQGDLLAAFNGGFRLADARGGFTLAGRTAGALRTGAASLVIDEDGTASVGAWGRDMGPALSGGAHPIAAVRQNLDLLVDGGQVAAGIENNTGGRWGLTLGNKLYVWRSGIGQTSSGALVYVAGNGLSAPTLAQLLRRAGAVRAMELDINPEWTSFITFPGPTNLLPDMQRSPHRYDSTSTRDFFAVLRRAP